MVNYVSSACWSDVKNVIDNSGYKYSVGKTLEAGSTKLIEFDVCDNASDLRVKVLEMLDRNGGLSGYVHSCL